MGQIKGTPTYTTQQQAYIDKYGSGAAANREPGSKPVLIAGNTTLNSVVDGTFATDSDVALKVATSTLTSLSASLASRLSALEV